MQLTANLHIYEPNKPRTGYLTFETLYFYGQPMESINNHHHTCISDAESTIPPNSMTYHICGSRRIFSVYFLEKEDEHNLDY